MQYSNIDPTEYRPSGGSRLTLLRDSAISLGVMILLTVVVYQFKIPNPNMILIAGLIVITSLLGYIPGAIGGAEMIVYSYIFFIVIKNDPQGVEKVITTFIGIVMTIVFIGQLKKRQTEATQKLREANERLEEDNMILKEASVTDALTGIKNRYALRRDYDHFRGKYIHVMMIDLNGFKNINDTYGHEVGDALIRQAGRVLRETFGGDSSYRYGGDEFLVVCPDVTQEHFEQRVDEIRGGFEQITISSTNIPVHFSGGYVHGTFELEYDLRLMIRQADDCMYRAKRGSEDVCIGAEYSREVAESLDKKTHTGRFTGRV